MSKLLMATRNPAKIREMTEVLATHVAELVTPDDLGLSDDPPEDGTTFAENSLLKANFYWQRSKLPVIADDGGLEVDALYGEPGVHSRRWGGRRLNDDELRTKLLTELRDVPDPQRTARLTTVVTLRLSRDMNFQQQMSLEGLIRDSTLPTDPGYPFRSIFYLPAYRKFFVELTPAEHEQVNHRRRALLALLPYIEQYL